MLSTKFRFLPSGFSPAANDKIFCTDSASKAPSIFDISRTGKKKADPQVVRKGGGQKPAPLSCDVSYKAEEGNADNNGQPGHWEHESRFRWLLLLRSAGGGYVHGGARALIFREVFTLDVGDFDSESFRARASIIDVAKAFITSCGASRWHVALPHMKRCTQP
jgi:hypothetical protein